MNELKNRLKQLNTNNQDYSNDNVISKYSTRLPNKNIGDRYIYFSASLFRHFDSFDVKELQVAEVPMLVPNLYESRFKVDTFTENNFRQNIR